MEKPEVVFMALQFDHMVLAHARWKTRLRNMIESGERIDAAVVGKDDQCELGQWIYSEGAKYANLPAFVDLKAKHARFHTCVAGVIQQARSLPPAKALELIDPAKSDFGHCSVECINAIAALRNSLA